MGEFESQKLYVFCAYVVNRDSLTQPQRRRGTETRTAAVPHPHNSAKSHLPQSTQRTQRPHQRIIGLSRTGL